MLSAIIVIIGISLLIVFHEWGHFWAARKSGVKVEEFGFGLPPRIFKWRPKRKVKEGETLRQAQGDTVYSVNWLPFGGFVRLFGEHAADLRGMALTEEEKRVSFTHQKARTKLTIIAAGIAFNFLLGWLILSAVFMIGAADTVVATAIMPDSPAATAGLEPGDKFVGYTTAPDFINYIDANKGKQIDLAIIRNGEELTIALTPRLDPPKGQGALGVALSQAGFPKLGFFAALKEGLISSVQIMAEILKTFGRLISSLFTKGEILEGVVGPIGIFAVAGDLGALGFVYLLQLIGLISLNLAILNAIPFPALDGGRFLFIIIEKLKGSPIGPKKEMAINLAGFGLLLLLMIAVTVRDIIALV